MILESLNVPHCAGCPFKTPTCGTRGPVDSPFVIVGESAASSDIRGGLPFSGPGGKVLDGVFPADFEVEPFIINAIACMKSPEKDAKKAQTKLAAGCHSCHTRLHEQIAAHPRKVILTLGNGAAWSILGNYDLKITKARGRRHESPYAEVGVVAAVHPAFLLRGGGSLRQFRGDIMYAVDLFRRGRTAIRRPDKPNVYILNSAYDVERYIDWILHTVRPTAMAADIETGGFDFFNDEILCLGLAHNENDVYIIPEHYIPLTKRLLECCNIQFGWHNGKFDIKFFRAQHSIQARVDEDTMLMSYALDEIGGVHDLETVASDWLGAPDYKFMVKPYLPNSKTSYRVIPKDVLWEYAAYDVNNTFRLMKVMRQSINADKLSRLQYEKTLIPGSEFLTTIEMAGFYTDQERIGENEIVQTAIIDEQEQIINQISLEKIGTPTNPGSWQQLQRLLYDKDGFAMKIKGVRPLSTDKDIIELLPQTPVIVALKAFRKAAKANGTYVAGLRQHLTTASRIHSTFKLHGTVTGRLASSDPNLQNIPRLPELRGQFTATPGNLLVEIDLSQAELRCLAILSGCPVLLEVFRSGGSPHDVTAAGLFGENWKSYPQGGKEQKMIAKNVNFGIIYGITAFGLADQININGKRQGATKEYTHEECQTWLDGWASTYKVAWAFIERCRISPAKGINLTTRFGYRKRAGVITQDRLQALGNEAANFPHQSTASTITLHTGMEIQQRVKNHYKTDIVNIVHDALLFDAPPDMSLILEMSMYVMSVMKRIPGEWGLHGIPFESEAEIGTRWGSLNKTKVKDGKLLMVDH